MLEGSSNGIILRERIKLSHSHQHRLAHTGESLSHHIRPTEEQDSTIVKIGHCYRTLARLNRKVERTIQLGRLPAIFLLYDGIG
jgi:hypothetical protein